MYEGFATYMGFVTINELEPSYDVWTGYLTCMYLEALRMDALKSSHPVEVSIILPSDLKESFDKLSCFKGAALFRLLETFIGEEHFKKGIHYFLSKNKHGSCYSDDLWYSLEHISAKPVTAVMDSWTVSPCSI